MTFLDGMRLNDEIPAAQGIERLFEYYYYINTYTASLHCRVRGGGVSKRLKRLNF